ncbi:hemerythrin domain-containing protein [Streptomyces sp. TP-A0356]|uniref:hemerythrin domain-containing protein n=1 Tax=Streptomyces sp. TP-A0356 TaxID=1359208 RepID=UPI0006E201E9|nr:hemerythrin domain-containing protein [Streptomyces sp. TP-A0356]
MGHGGDVINELTTDHREVENYFQQIESLPSGHQDRRKLADEMTIELVRHSVAEEMYLYPAVREHIEDGDAIADKEIADHARVEQALKQLEGCDVDDPQFDRLFITVKNEVKAHVEDEENNLFPKLRMACSQEMLDTLGEKIRMGKKIAPTRPHPAAPDTPPLNKIIAPGTGLVDRVRDFVTGRGRS